MAERKSAPDDPRPGGPPAQEQFPPQPARPTQLAHPLRRQPDGTLATDPAEVEAREERYRKINEAQRGAPLEAYAAQFITRGQPSKYVPDAPFHGVLVTDGQSPTADIPTEPGPPPPEYYPTEVVRVRPKSEEDVRRSYDPRFNRAFGGPGPGSLPSLDPLVEGNPEAAPEVVPPEAHEASPASQ